MRPGVLAVLGPDPEEFPPVSNALTDPPGLLAVGGDLSVARLLAAYRQGIFPWFGHGDPILWWSPDPRVVLDPAAIHIGRSLRRTLQRSSLRITVDLAFRQVIHACAHAPRADQHDTWITPAMQQAYLELHQAGHAHSVEAWQGNTLVGGLYGVALGRVFFGESMFARADDASKIALVALCTQLADWRFPLVDCQMPTDHLARFGAHALPRAEFCARVATACRLPEPDWPGIRVLRPGPAAAPAG